MDKDLLQKGELKLKLESGNLVLIFDSAGVDAQVSIESGYFLDKLAAVIPGEVDDTIIAILKGALKG